jgi:hypothetical protein
MDWRIHFIVFAVKCTAFTNLYLSSWKVYLNFLMLIGKEMGSCFSLLPNSSIFLSFFNVNAFGWIILCWICDKVYFWYTFHAYSSSLNICLYCVFGCWTENLCLRVWIFFFSLIVIHFAILSVAWGLNGQIVCNTWCLGLINKQMHPINYTAYDDPRAVLCAVHVTVTQSAVCQSSF